MKTNMPVLHVSININKDELLRYYSGGAKYVVAPSLEGPTVQLPIRILRSFVTSNGIDGTFKVSYNSNNKLINIEKL